MDLDLGDVGMNEFLETELGDIPSNWSTKPIGNMAFVTKLAGYEYTKFFKYIDDGEIIALRALNVREGNLDLTQLKRISREVSDALPRSKLIKGDILFTYVGANIGQFALINENNKYHLAPNICLIRPNENCDAYFVYSYFRTNFFRENLSNYSVGSSQPTLPMGNIRKIILPCPPIEEQKAIAAVLRSLDDKIDLLHRQNKTVEGMAETLFRQWFVEEAREDWEFVALGQYVNCFNGVSYKSDDLNPSTLAMVTLKSFGRDGGFRLDGFKEFTGRYKEQHIVTQGSLVVAHTDITQDADVIGNPVLVVADPLYEKLVISMDLVKISPKYEWLSAEFLYSMMKTKEFKQHCLGHSNGSTVLHLNKQAIPTYEFFLPSKDRIDEFTKLAKNLFKKKFQNITQIRTLEKLRDNLLPKLMSGEVRVDCALR